MKQRFLWILFLPGFVLAQNINIVYMGIVPGGAPEFEERFDDRVREQVAVIPGTDLVDYNDTEYLKKKTDFIDSPVLSRSFIESLMLVASDKTVVVWGKVSDFSIKPARCWLLGAEAVGSLTLVLTMYSLGFHEYAFLGDVTCRASVPKPPAFFRSVDKVTHITASDRAEIIKELQKQAAEKSTDILSDVIRSQLMKSGVLLGEDVKSKKVSSVSDLFYIPTIEAPDVDKADKKKEEKQEEEEGKIEEKEEKTEEKEEP